MAAGPAGPGAARADVGGAAAGEGVEVEPADVGVELVFRHHPLGVAGEQVLAGRGEVAGDEQGGLVAADVADGDPPDLSADAGELDPVLVLAEPSYTTRHGP